MFHTTNQYNSRFVKFQPQIVVNWNRSILWAFYGDEYMDIYEWTVDHGYHGYPTKQGDDMEMQLTSLDMETRNPHHCRQFSLKNHWFSTYLR